MPVILQARTEGPSITYEPQDFVAYVSAIGQSGLVPPAVPFRVRVPGGGASRSALLPVIEPEIAAFFGLGSVSGIDYVISRP
jgi:hypothetical protein